MNITFENHQLKINSTTKIFHAGEFQYFRAKRELWDTMLEKLKNAGINTISSYIPWSWHEFSENIFDFDGHTHPRRDLISFLELLKKYDFYFIARPGPYIYAEFKGYGVPDWVRKKYPEVLMLSEKKQPLTEVALTHPTFLQLVEKWYHQLFPHLKKFSKNTGKLLCIQLDNEIGLPQYSVKNVTTDWNPHTITQFQKWLEKKYQVVEPLNEEWNTHFRAISEILPPKRNEKNLHLLHSWMNFVEDSISMYMEKLNVLASKTGLATPIIFNVPFFTIWPDNPIKKSQYGPIGFDIYTKTSATGENITTDFPYAHTLIPRIFRHLNKKYWLFSAETQCGWLNPFTKVPNEHTLDLGASLFVNKTQLISWYLVHDAIEADGTPWIWNSALDIKGKETPRFSAIKKIGDLAAKFESYFSSYEMITSPIALAISSAGSRQLNFIQKEPKNVHTIFSLLSQLIGPMGLHAILNEIGYLPDAFFVESMNPEELSKYKILLFFSVGYLTENAWHNLQQYVAKGGTLLIFGPPLKYYIKEHSIAYISEETAVNNLTPFNEKKSEFSFNALSGIKILLDTIKFKVKKRKIKHKESLSTIEPFVGFEGLMKVAKERDWILQSPLVPFNVYSDAFTLYTENFGTPILNVTGKKAPTTVGWHRKLRTGGEIYYFGTLFGIKHAILPNFQFTKKFQAQIDFFRRILTKYVPPILYKNSIALDINILLNKEKNELLVMLNNRSREAITPFVSIMKNAVSIDTKSIKYQGELVWQSTKDVAENVRVTLTKDCLVLHDFVLSPHSKTLIKISPSK